MTKKATKTRRKPTAKTGAESAQNSGYSSGRRGAKPGTIPHNIEDIKKYSWKPGQSGNPGGRPSTKPLVTAMKEVLAENPELLKDIAGRALRQALADPRYFKEVRDMLDGKPPISLTGAEGAPLIPGSADPHGDLMRTLLPEDSKKGKQK